MPLVKCLECEEKIIESEGEAILECPKCGSTTIEVLEE